MARAPAATVLGSCPGAGPAEAICDWTGIKLEGAREARRNFHILIIFIMMTSSPHIVQCTAHEFACYAYVQTTPSTTVICDDEDD